MVIQEMETVLNEAMSLAEAWQSRANHLLTSQEKARQSRMARLMSHPMDKVALARLIDQSFRSGNNRRVADQVIGLFKEYGIPRFFSLPEKLLARLFLAVGRILPGLSVPGIISRMRQDSSGVIIPGEEETFRAYLRRRKNEGAKVNINHIGEAVLGEGEAVHRVEQYLEALRSPEIACISIKISSIYSQVHSLAFDHTVGVLKNRLSQLYRAARDNGFTGSDGIRTPKFVNLDMEQYRDLEITTAAFKETLEESDLANLSAGIALQSYLPDSFRIQQELTQWARKRVAKGGSPIRVRIAKGANLEMERVESSLQNWPLAPYDNKLDVDANFKRMVEYGMVREHVEAVHLGIASHNLFDLAYAFKLAQHNGVASLCTIEMLEGMADHVRRAVQETTGDLLLYAPVASKEQFLSAVAYLVRRLDENTGEENFLRYACDLRTRSKKWAFLKEQFIAAWKHKEDAGTSPHRVQNRLLETFPPQMGTFHKGEFTNEPDTDWSLAPNRAWADQIRESWKRRPYAPPLEIPVVVGAEEIFGDREIGECLDPSQINPAICLARFSLANDHDVERAVTVAREDPDAWRAKTHHERHELLSKVAMELRRARGDLIGAATANTGKVFTEADVEVSEAIDFAEYYPFSARTFTEMPHVSTRGKGVGLVISPWNFPIAIPCGGILAFLAAGNTVIFKPSSDAVLVAWQLCRCFWDAGISRNVLQFLPCSGATTGSRLATHQDVDAVILTGGTDTGLRILQQRPEAFLSAETGGKNATIVTAMADRDQAIKNVIHSAFSNCGQKCSATSLLILEREVFEDRVFKRQLVDTARSLAVGSAWDFENRLGPMIRPPEGHLKRALTELEPGETWALMPRNILDNPHMWTPGIKWNVQPGSTMHMTELFGPLLGVMRAENLDHAVELVNQTGYGLTSGLESLDRREQERWKATVKAGNLYINRGTTGAITLRQPFGGMGKSALGIGIKAGGPDYVAQFMTFEEVGFPTFGAIEKDHALLRLANEWDLKLRWEGLAELKTDMEKTIRAIKSYLYTFERELSRGKDFFHLRGQDNTFKYVPLGTIVVRIHERDSLFDVLARIAAVRISGARLIISIPEGLNNGVVAFLEGKEGKQLVGDGRLLSQSDQDLIASMNRTQRIRYGAPDRAPHAVLEAAAGTGLTIAGSPVMMEGRLELLQYFQQQSVCDTYHRYGNLGERATI